MSERPWIEWHGGPCPVARGTLVDLKRRCGRVDYRIVALSTLHYDDGTHEVVAFPTCGGTWLWISEPDLHVIAWRLSNDPQVEADRVNAYQAMWQDMAKRFTCDGPEDPKRLPLPKKEGVR